VQQEGSSIEINNPSGEIDTGYKVCTELKNTKPADRYLTIALMEQDYVYSRINIIAALHHLCLDVTDTGY